MAQRHYQYISRRKIAAELPWPTGTRTASSKTGPEAGFAAFGGTLSLSHVTEPVTESEATLVHWVDELEDHWRGPVPRPQARHERLILGTPYFVALPH